MAWFFAAVGALSVVINRGWLANIRLPRWYRGRHRNPSAAHPAARAVFRWDGSNAADIQPSTAPLSDYERWLEERFQDAEP